MATFIGFEQLQHFESTTMTILSTSGSPQEHRPKGDSSFFNLRGFPLEVLFPVFFLEAFFFGEVSIPFSISGWSGSKPSPSA
jgi:hypothetical protein